MTGSTDSTLGCLDTLDLQALALDQIIQEEVVGAGRRLEGAGSEVGAGLTIPAAAF